VTPAVFNTNAGNAAPIADIVSIIANPKPIPISRQFIMTHYFSPRKSRLFSNKQQSPWWRGNHKL
jgi:hypothetical protein